MPRSRDNNNGRRARRGGLPMQPRQAQDDAPGVNRGHSARAGRVLVTEGDEKWFGAAARAGVHVSGSDSAPLYRMAFTHRSAAPRGDPGACNERLEFLGDSIISAAVTRYLFDRFPSENEGFLTDMRSKLVKGQTLAALANKTGLVAGLVRKDTPSPSLPFDPAHEDLFEAVVGALSIDAGFAAAAAWVTSVVEKHMDVSELVRASVSSRAALQKEAKSVGVSGLDVEATCQAGGVFKAVVRCDGRVAGVGEGSSAKSATETACAAARIYLGLADL